MNEMENSNNSDFQKIFHRTRKSAQVVTMKSGEKSISDGSYISPPGHISTLKNVSVTEDAISLQLVTMAGVRMEDGRTWVRFNWQLNKHCNCIFHRQKITGTTQTLFVQLKVLLLTMQLYDQGFAPENIYFLN